MTQIITRGEARRKYQEYWENKFGERFFQDLSMAIEEAAENGRVNYVFKTRVYQTYEVVANYFRFCGFEVNKFMPIDDDEELYDGIYTVSIGW